MTTMAMLVDCVKLPFIVLIKENAEKVIVFVNELRNEKRIRKNFFGLILGEE